MNTKYSYDTEKYRFRELVSELYQVDKLEEIHKDKSDWASVIYLTPDAPSESGTTIYRKKKYGEYESDVVVGNVIGSNLANIFIFGLITLIFSSELINIPLESLALLSGLEISLFCIFFIYFISNKKEKIIHLHSVVGFLLISVYYLFYKFL